MINRVIYSHWLLKVIIVLLWQEDSKTREKCRKVLYLLVVLMVAFCSLFIRPCEENYFFKSILRRLLMLATSGQDRNKFQSKKSLVRKVCEKPSTSKKKKKMLYSPELFSQGDYQLRPRTVYVRCGKNFTF